MGQLSMRYLHIGDLCLRTDAFNGISSKIFSLFFFFNSEVSLKFFSFFFNLEIADHGPLVFPLKEKKVL